MKKLTVLFIATIFFLSGVNIFMQNGKVQTRAYTHSDTIQTYAYNGDIVAEPSVIVDVNSSSIYQGLISGSAVRPASAIISYSQQSDAIDANGAKIDTFINVINALTGKGILPIVYIEEVNQAIALNTFFDDTASILDITVMSKTPELVKIIREANPHIRGAIYFNSGGNPYDMVKNANLNLANIVVIDKAMATDITVSYIQARFKSVWVMSEDDESSIIDSIASGAYGIITQNYDKVYKVFDSYPSVLVRTPFNVAHRGVPSKKNENSLSGVKYSAENGATHIELDILITTDNQIVCMHDATLNRTTTGQGLVESMTLAQLRQYKLSQIEEEEIPTIDDIFEYIKDTDVVLVLEIKSAKEKIAQTLGDKLDEYNISDQVVVITFDYTMLGYVKKHTPHIPTGYLFDAENIDLGDFLERLGKNNTGIDLGRRHAYKSMERSFRDRGYIGWYWTFSDETILLRAVENGYMGLTNDCADALKSYPKSIVYKETYKGAAKIGDKFDIEILTFGGEKKVVEAEIFLSSDNGAHKTVVAKIPFGETFYTTKSLVFLNEKKGLDSLYYALGGVVTGGLIIAGSVMIIKTKQRKKTEN